ncbi:BRI1 kinase inhibitor 1-like isoform X2 [Cucurbita pepo subsp. pepo]|uniref:BRI1 kinase inhibitor 1-like isoform X2 n=1 Tax=Cucurbita pepo subsp. pepo TaxID=3664 RepID=UPI000C9D9D20|nr:BRI1 kinase inhibitor 1-like isoform X2 [Cucurbita pepo subsp. pepo]
MNSNQKQKTAEEEVAEYKQEAESFEVEETSPPLPPSASSSPSHEFSFTTPLHSSSHKPKSKPSPPSFAIDLSPADDIFFHGHLLPLHLLSHLPSSSPRSSTTSIPIKHFWDHQDPIKDTSSCSISSPNHHPTAPTEPGGRTKSKPFSLLGFPKWRKGCDTNEKNDRGKHKRKLGFDVTQVLKRYARVVRPFLLFRWRKESFHIRRQAYSFSGNLNPRNKQEQLRGRRGEFSAPASMRTSPTNSGLLVATPSMTSSSSSSDSTMEELQSAIQAAIAHCKNSIAKDDKTIVKSCY